MKDAIALGIRLALRTSRDGRTRAGLVALAALVGTLVILSVLAIAAADRAANPGRYGDGGMQRVIVLIVVLFAVQVAGLAGVAGRLAAALRSRRLSNLRLLGLSAGRTRLVAAIEVAVAASGGAIVGVAVFPIVRALLARLRMAGQPWTAATLDPPPAAWVAVPVGVVVVVVAVAVLPERLQMRSALRQARRADARPPSWWRLVPLTAGIAGCTHVQVARRGDESAAGLMLAGIALLALGTVFVLPVFVRLVATVLLRGSGRVTTLVAARRLQTQPAAVTRVVTGLLLALFVVVGARCVVAAWEATPQYVASARQVHEAQRFVAGLAVGGGTDIADAVRGIEAFPGVRDIGVYYLPVERCAGAPVCGQRALVADCRTFALVAPDASGCRDGEVMGLGGHGDKSGSSTWTPDAMDGPLTEPTIVTPPPEHAIDFGGSFSVIYGSVLIPPTFPGVDQLVALSTPYVQVTGDPGRHLGQRLVEAGLVDYSGHDGLLDEYDFVAMLRTIVYSVAAVVVGIGLLGFAISAIDRAISRRGELVSLRLVGVPAATLRRAQWIEALIPITAGSLLAIALGQLAGATYLAFGDDPDTPNTIPWQPTLMLALLVAIGGLIAAALTVVASNQPIDPDMIRAE